MVIAIESVKYLLLELKELDATFPTADYLNYCLDCGIGYPGRKRATIHEKHTLIRYEIPNIHGLIIMLEWLLQEFELRIVGV